MVDLLLALFGAMLALTSVALYVRECRGNVGPSMGGEMTFSSLWFVGTLLLALGILGGCDVSRLWTLLVAPTAFGVSFPLRSAVARIVCVPYTPEPTGFQKFVRKTEAKKKSQPPLPRDRTLR